ncbi:cis-zeatin O-glucosyltransferase 2 [Iris pallida]|uniref:Glycosyltransferase n=1 Tax=Iris pallida TaxID=29817 RepID=A0AAX6HQN6_IRIPA|nr:cis-zeatin O-glucosyltransferase 2 [Iris pallida]
MEQQQQQQEVSFVMLPLPAQGHLNQLLHLAGRVAAYNVPVHYVGYATHNRQARDRADVRDYSTANPIKFHDVPVPPTAFSAPPPPPNPNSTSTNFPSHLQPAFDAALALDSHLLSLLRSLSAASRRVVLVHDSTMAFAASVASSLPNVESFSFHSVSAFTVLFFHWQSRGRSPDRALSALPELSFQGCFSDEFLDFIRRQHEKTVSDSGRLLNTCRAIEGPFVDRLALEPSWQGQKVFAVGPLNPLNPRKGAGGASRHKCLDWLDRQPENSVIYVSFGTTSTLPKEQVLELAYGLESSNQRFVWVLRDADRSDIYAAAADDADEKVVRAREVILNCERGMVLGGWAPQLEILAHPSTGGFLTHCGWNSCMESMSMGVPMLAWPMHSDQPRNTMLVTEVLRVGAVAREWAKREEVLPAAKIRDSIVRLMVGKEGLAMRRRAQMVGEAIRGATMEGGTSKEDLDSFMDYVTRS